MNAYWRVISFLETISIPLWFRTKHLMYNSNMQISNLRVSKFIRSVLNWRDYRIHAFHLTLHYIGSLVVGTRSRVDPTPESPFWSYSISIYVLDLISLCCLLPPLAEELGTVFRSEPVRQWVWNFQLGSTFRNHTFQVSGRCLKYIYKNVNKYCIHTQYDRYQNVFGFIKSN